MVRHRVKFVLFCAAQFVITGCMQHTVAKNGAIPSPPKVNEKSPLSLSDYIRTVYQISEQNTVEAEELRRKALDSNPELAQLAARVAADSKDVQSRTKLAAGYQHEGLLWSAYHLFHEARNLQENNFDAEIGLAQIWDKWGDYSLARQHAAAAVTINPSSAEAYEVIGRIHLHRNAAPEAIESFKTAAELAPEKPGVLANLGYAYMLSGKLSDAKATLTKALSLDANLTEARNNLGIVLAQMGDYQGSLAEMQKVAAPEVALNNLGAVLLSQKKPVEAAQVLQQAVESNPNYQKAAENLAAARALTPPPAVVTLPSFGPAPVKRAAETPKTAPAPAASVAPVAAPSTPAPVAAVETPLPTPKATTAPPAPVVAPVTTTAVAPAAEVKKAEPKKAAEPVKKTIVAPKTVAAAPAVKVEAPKAEPAAEAPKATAAPAVAKTAPKAEAPRVEAPKIAPSEDVKPVGGKKPATTPAKPAAEPRKAAEAVRPAAPPVTETAAPAATESKHDEIPAAAVVSAQNIPPTSGPTAAPTSANLLPVYAGLAAVGLGVIAYLSAKSLAGMRARRTAKRAILGR